FFFSSRRRHTRSKRDWSSDVCSSDLSEVRGMFRIETDSHARDTVLRLSGWMQSRHIPELKGEIEGSGRKIILDLGKVTLVDRERSEEHTSELQSRFDLVCRLLLEKKK